MSVPRIFTQSPNEILDRTAKLLVDDGDTLSQTSWACSPAGLTIASGAPSGIFTTARISGGTLGTSYSVTVHGTGFSGQQYEQSITLKIAQKAIAIFRLDPSEILDFEATLRSGDVDPIAAATWTITPPGPVVTASSFTPLAAHARISGAGAPIGLYTARVLITGASAQRYEESVSIKVQQR